MKKRFLTFSAMIACSAFVLTSCSSEEWTKKHEDDFMKGCVEAAHKSFVQRGITADSTMVTNICDCTLDKVKVKYKANESEKIKTPEGMAWAQEATKECALEFVPKK